MWDTTSGLVHLKLSAASVEVILFRLLYNSWSILLFSSSNFNSSCVSLASTVCPSVSRFRLCSCWLWSSSYDCCIPSEEEKEEEEEYTGTEKEEERDPESEIVLRTGSIWRVVIIVGCADNSWRGCWVVGNENGAKTTAWWCVSFDSRICTRRILELLLDFNQFCYEVFLDEIRLLCFLLLFHSSSIFPWPCFLKISFIE